MLTFGRGRESRSWDQLKKKQNDYKKEKEINQFMYQEKHWSSNW
jgi:hypothetical protein